MWCWLSRKPLETACDSCAERFCDDDLVECGCDALKNECSARGLGTAGQARHGRECAGGFCSCSGLAQLAHAVLGRSRWRVVALWLADLPGVVVGRSACVGVRGGGLLYMSLGSGRLGLLFGCCSAEAH